MWRAKALPWAEMRPPAASGPLRIFDFPRKVCRPNLPLLCMTPADAIRIERPTTDSKLFAHPRWDVVPTPAALFQFAYFFALYFLFPHTPLWIMLIMGFVFSLMINANIN